jgi:hypothetical protein
MGSNPHPLRFPPVKPLPLYPLGRAHVFLVGCCVHSSSGGQLKPWHILFQLLFVVQFDGLNDGQTSRPTRSAPVVSLLKSPSHHQHCLLNKINKLLIELSLLFYVHV